MASISPAPVSSSYTLVLAAALALVSACAPAPSGVAGETVTELDRLLESYRPGQSPADTAAGLGDDRLAVLRAVVWAGSAPLTDSNGHPAGTPARLVDYLIKVDGIWGVRPGDTQGKHQFRLTVRMEPALVPVLVRAREYDESGWCHVIVGNDDPGDTQPPRSVAAGRCFRGVDFPSMQVSFAKENPPNGPLLGEIDIDYDPWTLIDWGKCHNRPSNSDVRAWKSNSDHHPREFDGAFDQFAGPLSLVCTSNRFHCEKSYADRNCP